MKKIIIIIFLFILCTPSYAFFFKKKEKSSILLSSSDPRITLSYDEKIKNEDIFKNKTRIYFLVHNPEGFKSDYIKYQIFKQDDKAHIGGYSRVRNITKKINNKNYYIDYFVLSEPGKYGLQIFDIENLHHWIAFAHFIVVEK
jgi:regulatory protein YycI of two-component signal transduction system YycFG